MRRDDAEKDWIVINKAGECNREIALIEEHVCAVMINKLSDWLNYDWADVSAFCMCGLKNILCEAGFYHRNEDMRDPGECPFNVCEDSQTGQRPCCFTVLAGGYCVIDFLDPIRDYMDGDAPSPRHNKNFKIYVQAMRRFYQRQKARSICAKEVPA